jgi:hypothetical protein
MKESPTSLTEILIIESLFFFLFGGVCFFLDDKNSSLFFLLGKYTLGAGLLLGAGMVVQKTLTLSRHPKN